MIDGFVCDKCGSLTEIMNLGVLGSPNDACNPYVEMITLCKKCLVYRIEELIKNMSIPTSRKSDYKWLSENLHTNNSGHENFNELLFLINAQLTK